MGKTAFVTDLILHALKYVPVAFFSVEMGAGPIGERLLSKRAVVDLLKLRRGEVEEAEFKRIISVAGDLSELPLVIDESPEITAQQIRSRVRQVSVKIRKPIGLVVVDYLQLLTPGQKTKHQSREQEIASFSRDMKRVAKDLSVPVILLSQLNRELEKRPNNRPTLADLRESGAIEQDADLVLGLYQPFPYTKQDEDWGKAELIILKQRNGPVGTIDLKWVPETATFFDV